MLAHFRLGWASPECLRTTAWVEGNCVTGELGRFDGVGFDKMMVMNILPLVRWFCCGAFIAGLLTLGIAQAQSESDSPLQWTQAPSHPNAVGLASPFAGSIRSKLVVAGGANFPDQKPWEGGTKVWHDDIAVLDLSESNSDLNGSNNVPSNDVPQWTIVADLPKPLAYGVTASFADGLICVGGSDAQRHYAECFFLTELDSQWICLPLPLLPAPLANACGTIVDDYMVVFGGLEHPDATKCLNVGWKLKLEASKFAELKSSRELAQHIADGWNWEPLPHFSSAGRMLSTAACVEGRFWVLGGTELVGGDDGKSKRRYLNECWSLRIVEPAQEAGQENWVRELDLPVPLAASPSPAFATKSGLWILGGDDGSQVGNEPSAHRGFTHRAFQLPPFDQRTLGNTRGWQVHEHAVVAPRVTVPAVLIGSEYWIISGEQRPGVRSPEVWRVGVEGE